MKNYVTSTAWLNAFLIAAGVSILAYLANLYFGEIDAGNIWGLTYGTAAAILFFGAAFYGIRRRTAKFSSKKGLGKTSTWLQFHLYGGVMFMLLTLMHTGFHLPHGMLNWLLWGLSLWVTISGLLGVALQKWISGALSSGLEIEVIYERIPELAGELQRRAETLAAGAPEVVQHFYNRELSEQLKAPRRSWRFFVDISGGAHPVTSAFTHLRRALSSEQAETATELEAIYKSKLALDAHYSLQSVLRGWLIFHLPLSILLTALVIIHLFVVYYY